VFLALPDSFLLVLCFIYVPADIRGLRVSGVDRSFNRAPIFLSTFCPQPQRQTHPRPAPVPIAISSPSIKSLNNFSVVYLPELKKKLRCPSRKLSPISTRLYHIPHCITYCRQDLNFTEWIKTASSSKFRRFFCVMQKLQIVGSIKGSVGSMAIKFCDPICANRHAYFSTATLDAAETVIPEPQCSMLAGTDRKVSHFRALSALWSALQTRNWR
jgi:hypothetical protein